VIGSVSSNVFGATWEGDSIYYGQPEGILRIPAAGGKSEVVVEAKPGEQLDAPELLPAANGCSSALFVTGLPST
jgi:hypothetical protein